MKWAQLIENLDWFIGKYCGPDVVADFELVSDMCFALGVEPDICLAPVAPAQEEAPTHCAVCREPVPHVRDGLYYPCKCPAVALSTSSTLAEIATLNEEDA